MAQVSQLLDEQLGDNIDFVDINCGECSAHMAQLRAEVVGDAGD